MGDVRHGGRHIAAGGRAVAWAHHPTTRNIPNALRNLRLAWRLLRSDAPDVVVSDGAGVAVPFFVIAKLLGSATVYLEVYDRIDSRTLTGRLCRPFTDLFCVQWPEQQALYPGSLLIGGCCERSNDPALVLVVVGTDHHPFDRVVGWADEWAASHPGVRVLVQYGTSRPPTTAEGHDLLPVGDLTALDVRGDGGGLPWRSRHDHGRPRGRPRADRGAAQERPGRTRRRSPGAVRDAGRGGGPGASGHRSAHVVEPARTRGERGRRGSGSIWRARIRAAEAVARFGSIGGRVAGAYGVGTRSKRSGS